MRNFITACICVMVSLFTCTKVWSQSTVNLGFNLGAGNTGFPKNGRLGLGGSVEFINRLWKGGGVRMYIGYDWFEHSPPKNIAFTVLRDSIGKYPNLFADNSFLPIRMGYQQFLLKNAAFLYLEAGLVRWTPSYSNKRNFFTYAVGTGYKFSLSERKYLQLSFIYNQNLRKLQGADGQKVSMDSNYFTFRAAYGLHFQRKLK